MTREQWPQRLLDLLRKYECVSEPTGRLRYPLHWEHEAALEVKRQSSLLTRLLCKAADKNTHTHANTHTRAHTHKMQQQPGMEAQCFQERPHNEPPMHQPDNRSHAGLFCRDSGSLWTASASLATIHHSVYSRIFKWSTYSRSTWAVNCRISVNCTESWVWRKVTNKNQRIRGKVPPKNGRTFLDFPDVIMLLWKCVYGLFVSSSATGTVSGRSLAQVVQGYVGLNLSTLRL